MTHPRFPELAPYLEASVGGVDALFDHYFAQLDALKIRLSKARSFTQAISHGDLCFSNILYSKMTGLMRFIDPKGASTPEELFLDPTYDIAKLAHSIVGNYDFINQGLFELTVRPDLSLQLTLERASPAWAKAQFNATLREMGWHPEDIQLLAASLFLSMPPLHMDSPQKALAFLLNAHQLLEG